ncbi:cell division protein ZapE [Niveispirillum sp. SYP-B3756]|uniref:cell division protein ZapE n=1 Tax=Niveispirillum sp. SYP-B3756 TaxID=2662178 RepID=UPI001291C612|nr:cell division protein ZapE [Niveispirillum sp. SYP-B3756]MQP65193.1 cell division protein ZapE [Niveispirillum sp. SYP-B3756]
MTEGPLSVYRARRGTGTLKADPAQELAAEKLQSLWHALKDYKPASGQTGWRARFGLTRRPDPAPQGLFIYGDVGRGKSMLMDLFYETVPVEQKVRVHFHAFMLEVHERLHAIRREGSVARKGGDEVVELSKQIAAKGWLLCFDEFHVTDVTNAMILGRLFTALFDQGIVMVATSNWAPDDLYKDGLNRPLFLPFIALLKEKLDVLHLASERDYRLARLMGAKVYHYPLGPGSSTAMQRTFDDLTDGQTPEPVELTVQGRKVAVPRAARGVAWFSFDDLCAKPLGAGDYLAIATHFHTVLIDYVPKLSDAQRNEAKRFMTLIDALYEHKVNAVIAAEVAPERIYAEGTHAFEFQRTVSRMMEMQARDYLERAHLT